MTASQYCIQMVRKACTSGNMAANSSSNYTNKFQNKSLRELIYYKIKVFHNFNVLFIT